MCYMCLYVLEIHSGFRESLGKCYYSVPSINASCGHIYSMLMFLLDFMVARGPLLRLSFICNYLYSQTFAQNAYIYICVYMFTITTTTPGEYSSERVVIWQNYEWLTVRGNIIYLFFLIYMIYIYYVYFNYTLRMHDYTHTHT